MTFFGFDMLPFCLDKLPSPHDGRSRAVSGNYISNSDFITWQHPVYEWKVLIGNLTINVEKGKEPNAFHRVMQELVLGFKWRK